MRDVIRKRASNTVLHRSVNPRTSQRRDRVVARSARVRYRTTWARAIVRPLGIRTSEVGKRSLALRNTHRYLTGLDDRMMRLCPKLRQRLCAM